MRRLGRSVDVEKTHANRWPFHGGEVRNACSCIFLVAVFSACGVLSEPDAPEAASANSTASDSTASRSDSAPLSVAIWHGDVQRVGHLGDAQDDFNLMGQVSSGAAIDKLAYRLNGGDPVELTVGESPWGFRRLAGPGHFNADIPISELQSGGNTVLLTATDKDGSEVEKTITLNKLEGSTPFPLKIRWNEVSSPQDVGQYVDGHWGHTETGLRTLDMGYDRTFLIGERTWKDYEVAVLVTINEISPETSPTSGGHGLGMILRFSGHVIGGFRDFPEAQPKWGYQPFGAIGWLRWTNPTEPPQRQFYRGDDDHQIDHGAIAVEEGSSYYMKFACLTLPNDSLGNNVTRYSFKIWPEEEPEPDDWDWEETQVSEEALEAGGVALVAHHIDATFGDIMIRPKYPYEVWTGRPEEGPRGREEAPSLPEDTDRVRSKSLAGLGPPMLGWIIRSAFSRVPIPTEARRYFEPFQPIAPASVRPTSS